MTARLLDRSFRYFTAEESKRPGYLARRFAQIRREQKAREQAKAVVQPIKRAK